MSNNKRALGRGLDALLGSTEQAYNKQKNVIDATGKLKTDAVGMIAIDQIEVNPFQPRTEFEKEALIELATSIKTYGLIQPVTVRALTENKFQLISGERRFRASQAAGLTEIPAYIRVANDQSMLEMALVENIQRKDLNAVEVALSYKRLMEECDLTQEEMAQRLGKKRSTISNFLRVLNLSPEIQTALIEEKISFGHAKAILSINDEEVQLYLLKLIIDENYSVRQTEEWVKQSKNQDITTPSSIKTKKTKDTALSFQQQQFLDDLKIRFKNKVQLNINEKGKGKLSFNFNSPEELEKFIELLS